jgi:hypothetical protein
LRADPEMIATTFVEEAERCFAFFRELGYDAPAVAEPEF